MDYITLEDKLALEQAKYSKDIAALQHQIVLLKLAVKHELKEGDRIEDNCKITRVACGAGSAKPLAAEVEGGIK
jgi:hypothetical protein